MENKAKSILLELNLVSPGKELSANDVNSWDQTHAKKQPFKWTSSKKKPKNNKATTPSLLTFVRRRLDVTVEKQTPPTGRSSEIRETEQELISKSRISEFRLPSFDKKQAPFRLRRPQSKTNIQTRFSWNRVNPLTERR